MNDRINATRNVVRLKFLAEHQRQALHALLIGQTFLSRTEAAFLKRMRETPIASDRQARWVRDIDLRVTWEAQHVDS